MLLAHRNVAAHIVHVGTSLSYERTWHVYHSDQGPISICLWYRPPASGELESIRSIEDEMRSFAADCEHSIILGDMNCHNIEWLVHSSYNSPEGRELHDVACSHGLFQHVAGPTRGEYLLDLVLSDCGDSLVASVIKGVSDHHGISIDLKFSAPAVADHERELFYYAKADWDGLNSRLAAIEWERMPMDADMAAEFFLDKVMASVKETVPSRKVRSFKSSHPWLNAECHRAVQKKYESFGTLRFEAERDECTRILRNAYDQHVKRTRDKLCSMKASSKQWWRVAGSLLSKPSGVSSIPPLKSTDGTWARDGPSNAKLLSETFAAKSELPDPDDNEFTPEDVDYALLPDSNVSVDDDAVAPVLASLDEGSGTGPDFLAARVLKRCKEVLAAPIARLCNHIISCGRWPQLWRMHWVHPIHKRNSKANPSHYRGVHLTPQISKVCERVVNKLVRPWMDFGPRQFAYTPGRGHRDALLMNLLQWILWLERGLQIGLFCSDVSGAFDRVCMERLCGKLRALKMPRQLYSLLCSWLEERVSCVLVEGVCSDPLPLANSVFQGTVLGPPLWNQHFGDAPVATRGEGYDETVYADDLNLFKSFGAKADHADIREDLVSCQSALHTWGRGNRVLFDPAKESFHVLHRQFSSNSEFKILGVLFDSQLKMHSAVRTLVVQAGWRLKALLRAKRFFSTNQLVMLYKAQILSYIESGSVAFIHAPMTTMAPVDRLQRRFLREIGLSERDAMLNHRLAPLPVRRRIAALGVLHRRILGQLPECIAELLPLKERRASAYSTRLASNLHNNQLIDPAEGRVTELFRRSLFGYIAVFNRLSQAVVDLKSVKTFQGCLQSAVRDWAASGAENWDDFLSVTDRCSNIVVFQSQFCVKLT